MESFNYEHFCGPSQIERDFQTMIGILEGIDSDGVINNDEIMALVKWSNDIKKYEKREPYNTLVNKISLAISDYRIDLDEKEDLIWFCKQYVEANGYFDEVTKKIQLLFGILHGISSDNIINEKEVHFLRQWLESNSYLESIYPFDEISVIVRKVLQDGSFDSQESIELMNFCNLFTLKDSLNNNKNLVENLNSNVFEIEPDIFIENRTFCITGESKSYRRKDIVNKIISLGGDFSSSVTKRVDYLVVCEDRNVCWAFTNYGRKIEQVLKHRASGHTIAIVHEHDLIDEINRLTISK